MTETRTITPKRSGVAIRPYRAMDYVTCRALWGELVQHRSGLHPAESTADSRGSGSAPTGRAGHAAAFEEYLTRLDLSGVWVAELDREGVVGLAGLTLNGSVGEVEPIVVSTHHRGQGIGRAMLARLVDAARERGLQRLTISPSARDPEALRRLQAAGFDTASSVTLAYDLSAATTGRSDDQRPVGLYDLHFAV